MSNRTREIFEFAQLEPLLVDDIEGMIQICDEEEIDLIEQVADTLLVAIGKLESANGVLELEEPPV